MGEEWLKKSHTGWGVLWWVTGFRSYMGVSIDRW